MSSTIIQHHLDKINIPIHKIGQNLGLLRKNINKLKTNINGKDLVINYTKTKINNKQHYTTLNILKYLNNNELLNLEHYSKTEQYEFTNLINSNNNIELGKWINNNGNDIMKHANYLANTRQIPPQLYNSHIDINVLNNFVELNILDYLFNKLEYTHKYKISYKNLTINLVIYSKTKITKTLLNGILTRIITMGLFKSQDTKIVINVDIFLTQFKKLMNKDTKILGPREINSGFAERNKKLCIFRSEELNKVLVHELIHYLDLDLQDVDFKDFYKFFNISPNQKVLLNEAYAEIIAILINSIIDSPNITNNRTILNNELKFSFYQVAKILLFYGFTDANEFFQANTNTKFKQKTSIFSYFIVKTILLYNLNTFLDLYYKNQINRGNFKELILKLIDNKFIQLINKFMVYIKNNKQNSTLFNTLKMTYNIKKLI
jgi:hypothetical protein